MKINPCMSRGICFRLPDGSVAMLPLHIFRSAGSTVIRLGDTALFFDDDGRFDGEELHAVGAQPGDLERLREAIMPALAQSAQNQGEAPESFYFEVGSPGREREERSRAALAQNKPGPKRQVYSREPPAKPGKVTH